jgi:hypothetical protein
LEQFLFKPLWKLVVEPSNKRLPLVPVNFPGTDLLRGVITRPAYPELYAGRVVVQIVDLVINGIVLRIGSRGPLGRGLEVAIFHRGVVAPLRVPFEVITQVMNHGAGFG